MAIAGAEAHVGSRFWPCLVAFGRQLAWTAVDPGSGSSGAGHRGQAAFDLRQCQAAAHVIVIRAAVFVPISAIPNGKATN